MPTLPERRKAKASCRSDVSPRDMLSKMKPKDPNVKKTPARKRACPRDGTVLQNSRFDALNVPPSREGQVRLGAQVPSRSPPQVQEAGGPDHSRVVDGERWA